MIIAGMTDSAGTMRPLSSVRRQYGGSETAVCLAGALQNLYPDHTGGRCRRRAARNDSLTFTFTGKGWICGGLFSVRPLPLPGQQNHF